VKSLHGLTVKLFADGADAANMRELNANPWIKGFTTNPTLMRKAGITNYRAFAREVLAEIRDKPVSFEVLSDDVEEMERQALEIVGWADNVYVKIPVTNSTGENCDALVKRLTDRRAQVNVTAIMTLAQVRRISAALNPAAASFVSVFAGRIADTGLDPVPLMREAMDILESNSNAKLIWASPREIINIFQADAIGCPAITVTDDILRKLPLIGRDLADYSLDTVRMFVDDARGAGYSL
jgi:transaldolase